MTQFDRESLSDLVGNLRQLASVRQVVLQDGAEAGQRALIFSTGGGLDFWVLQDRSMDIGMLNWCGMPLAWQHPAGLINPSLHNSYDAQATGIEHSLSGFMVTCGLDNVRQPQNGLPLHGTFPYTPARLLSCGEDWDAPEPKLFAQAEMIRAHLNRDALSLTRRIEAPIGKNRLTVTDRVENIGHGPAEIRILYHTNFGFPAVADDNCVLLNGQRLPEAEITPHVLCCPTGNADETFCVELRSTPSYPWPAFLTKITGDARALPFFQVWRDSRVRRNVLALEPTNCDRNPDGTSAAGQILAPGETWHSSLTFEFGHTAKPEPNSNGGKS